MLEGFVKTSATGRPRCEGFVRPLDLELGCLFHNCCFFNAVNYSFAAKAFGVKGRRLSVPVCNPIHANCNELHFSRKPPAAFSDLSVGIKKALLVVERAIAAARSSLIALLSDCGAKIDTFELTTKKKR